jgi:hypothetical protein
LKPVSENLSSGFGNAIVSICGPGKERLDQPAKQAA